MFMIDLGGDNHYSFFGLSPDASAEEIKAARDALNKQLEEDESKVQDAAERARIEEKRKEVSRRSDELTRPDSRKKYDEANAHLRFLIVQPAGAPLFRSRADRAYVIDRVSREFLAAKGFAVEPLCDLGRMDFNADFTPVPELDRLLDK